MSLYYTTETPSSIASPKNVLAVLVHGGALSSNMYKTMMPYLTMPSVAIDLPGHGESAHLGPFTFEKSSKLIGSLITDINQRSEYQNHKILFVGVSLGGQAVLDFVRNHPSEISAAIASGASILPPDDNAAWEMPHMPTEQSWLDIMTSDIQKMGMENASALQNESFSFKFEPNDSHQYPPLLICVGENDVAMAKRDFKKLTKMAQNMNTKSEGRVLEGAWHNHPIDIPNEFAALINNWAGQILSS